MKALQITEFGPIENLRVSDVPDPALPADSVRVTVEAAGVNPSDAGVALGRFPQVTLPRILGRDFAGRVVEGPAELVGMPVWGSGGGELGITRDGSHAQYVILPRDVAIRRPDHLSAQEAAVVGVPFVTAWSALVELGAVQPGQWVLVSGAAGAVGSAALQLAAALGANPIALVLSRDNLDWLGGVRFTVLRSDRDDIPTAVRDLSGGRGADVALNVVGTPVFAPLFDSLAIGGRMIVISARGGNKAEFDLFSLYRRQLRLIGLDTAKLSLSQIARLYEKFGPYFESRAVKPPAISASYPLERAREAYERVEKAAAGKVVLLPNG